MVWPRRCCPQGAGRDCPGQTGVDYALVANLMLRCTFVLRFLVFSQVRNGVHRHPLLAEAEQQDERDDEQQTTHARILT